MDSQYCQAQPKPKLNLAGLSLALFLISPTVHRPPSAGRPSGQVVLKAIN